MNGWLWLIIGTWLAFLGAALYAWARDTANARAEVLEQESLADTQPLESAQLPNRLEDADPELTVIYRALPPRNRPALLRLRDLLFKDVIDLVEYQMLRQWVNERSGRQRSQYIVGQMVIVDVRQWRVSRQPPSNSMFDSIPEMLVKIARLFEDDGIGGFVGGGDDGLWTGYIPVECVTRELHQYAVGQTVIVDVRQWYQSAHPPEAHTFDNLGETVTLKVERIFTEFDSRGLGIGGYIGKVWSGFIPVGCVSRKEHFSE